MLSVIKGRIKVDEKDLELEDESKEAGSVEQRLLGRIRKYESEDYAREEPDIEVTKKRGSFALASIDAAEDLPDAEFMRKVLKAMALDLAVLRKIVKKTLGSLERLSEKSSEINPSSNGISSLIASGPLSSSSGSIYSLPINPSQLNTPNWAENVGSLLDSGSFASASQSANHQNPSSAFPQSGTIQHLLSGMNGALQLPGNIGQLPNENLVFQRG